MQRKVTFSDSHKVFFKLIWDAFRSRGVVRPEDRRVSQADRREERRILQALKAISDPVGDPPKDDDPDVRPRVLKPGGGVLALDVPEFTRLLKYVSESQWSSGVADLACDLEDWLESADKIEPRAASSVGE